MTSLTRQSRPWTAILLIALLLPQCIGLWFVFPYYAFTRSDFGLQLLPVALALLAAATLAGLWLGKACGIWAALVLVSIDLTLDLFAWSSTDSSERNLAGHQHDQVTSEMLAPINASSLITL